MQWEILWAVFGTIVAGGIVGFALWSNIRGGYNDYMDAIEDGVVTDEEKIKIADRLLDAVEDAQNLWSFILKIVAMFKAMRR